MLGELEVFESLDLRVLFGEMNLNDFIRIVPLK